MHIRFLSDISYCSSSCQSAKMGSCWQTVRSQVPTIEIAMTNSMGIFCLLCGTSNGSETLFLLHLFACRTVSPELKSYALGVLFLLLRLLGTYSFFIPSVVNWMLITRWVHISVQSWPGEYISLESSLELSFFLWSLILVNKRKVC